MPNFITKDQIRADFSRAMSTMYRAEVPLYGDLISIVDGVNQNVLGNGAAALGLDANEDIARITDERHGAIRVGTASELAMIARIFGVMGMHPVGYYDLGVAGIPVHSTAFRPIDRAALAQNPFRVFTSLLRLELIADDELREQAAALLANRQIFTDWAIELTQTAEREGGLGEGAAAEFVAEVLKTFRWNKTARVTRADYDRLHDAHRLIADVVGFGGPHINHLTPRTLDIDAAQDGMVAAGIPAKAVIEGPPKRQCPILLRQTSFKALREDVVFLDQISGGHTARFGEIEQRGVALTPKGRALYDRLLDDVRAKITPAADGSNADDYVAVLEQVFANFPDDWRVIHDEGLAYFRYRAVGEIDGDIDANTPLSELLDRGVVAINPIIYEDFLPVSAAGIFRSNLGDEATSANQTTASQSVFEAALGREVIDEFDHYAAISKASLDEVLRIASPSG